MTEPASPHHTSAATTTLPIDEQVDGYFDGLLAGAESEEQRAHFQRAIDELDPDLRNLGLGRKLIRLRRSLAQLDREERLFLGQIAESRARLMLQVREIETIFEAEAREYRKRTKNKTWEISGVGFWSTRRQPPRWAIDNAAAIAGMDADQRAEFTETPEPKPPEPKLKGKEFRRFLDDHFLDQAGNVKTDELPEGVERVEAQVNVDYSLFD